MIDTLRKCIRHKIDLNLCQLCWPDYLKYLGYLCNIERDKK